MLLKRMAVMATELIFQRKCLYCGRMMPNFGKLCVCPKCSKKKIKPIYHEEGEYIPNDVILLLEYKGNVRRTMSKFKFEGKKYYGYTFAREIYDSVGEEFFSEDAVMACIPIAKSRRRRYNQSEVIAAELSGLSGTEFHADILMKTYDNPPLGRMMPEERKFMVRGSIGVNPYRDVFDKHVIVIDDILTTGSTVNTAASALIGCGAKTVDAVCACSNKQY